MAGSEKLLTGTYLVDAPCPKCGVIEEVLVSIESVLTLPQNSSGSLRVRLQGKALDHDCAQLRLGGRVK